MNHLFHKAKKCAVVLYSQQVVTHYIYYNKWVTPSLTYSRNDKAYCQSVVAYAVGGAHISIDLKTYQSYSWGISSVTYKVLSEVNDLKLFKYIFIYIKYMIQPMYNSSMQSVYCLLLG